MSSILDGGEIRTQLERLARANGAFTAAYPGDPTDRQPVHTVYGGGHLFRHDVAAQLGSGALQAMSEWAPDWVTFARALGMPGADRLPTLPGERAALERQLDQSGDAATAHANWWLAREVHARVTAKLEREPVEDFRADFEDGYGQRPDAEEDGDVVRAAEEMALGLERGTLPPFIGIRIKPFTEELRVRSMRTLELFLATLLPRTGGRLPSNFVVTLPKVTIPEQVETLIVLFERLESVHGLPAGALRMEFMVETPTSVIAPDGSVPLRRFVAAARGRCRGAHFGVYDYTASVQRHGAPPGPGASRVRHGAPAHAGGARRQRRDLVGWCDHRDARPPAPRGGGRHAHPRPDRGEPPLGARRLEAALRRRPTCPARGLLPGLGPAPRAAADPLRGGHRVLPRGPREAAERLRRFVDAAAQATLLGQVFDDAATGQGLLNYFLRGLSCGALTEAEALATGLTLDELRGRSFVNILNARRGIVPPQLPR